MERQIFTVLARGLVAMVTGVRAQSTPRSDAIRARKVPLATLALYRQKSADYARDHGAVKLLALIVIERRDTNICGAW